MSYEQRILLAEFGKPCGKLHKTEECSTRCRRCICSTVCTSCVTARSLYLLGYKYWCLSLFLAWIPCFAAAFRTFIFEHLHVPSQGGCLNCVVHTCYPCKICAVAQEFRATVLYSNRGRPRLSSVQSTLAEAHVKNPFKRNDDSVHTLQPSHTCTLPPTHQTSLVAGRYQSYASLDQMNMNQNLQQHIDPLQISAQQNYFNNLQQQQPQLEQQHLQTQTQFYNQCLQPYPYSPAHEMFNPHNIAVPRPQHKKLPSNEPFDEKETYSENDDININPVIFQQNFINDSPNFHHSQQNIHPQNMVSTHNVFPNTHQNHYFNTIPSMQNTQIIPQIRQQQSLPLQLNFPHNPLPFSQNQSINYHHHQNQLSSIKMLQRQQFYDNHEQHDNHVSDVIHVDNTTKRPRHLWPPHEITPSESRSKQPPYHPKYLYQPQCTYQKQFLHPHYQPTTKQIKQMPTDDDHTELVEHIHNTPRSSDSTHSPDSDSDCSKTNSFGFETSPPKTMPDRFVDFFIKPFSKIPPTPGSMATSTLNPVDITTSNQDNLTPSNGDFQSLPRVDSLVSHAMLSYREDYEYANDELCEEDLEMVMQELYGQDRNGKFSNNAADSSLNNPQLQNLSEYQNIDGLFLKEYNKRKRPLQRKQSLPPQPGTHALQAQSNQLLILPQPDRIYQLQQQRQQPQHSLFYPHDQNDNNYSNLYQKSSLERHNEASHDQISVEREIYQESFPSPTPSTESTMSNLPHVIMSNHITPRQSSPKHSQREYYIQIAAHDQQNTPIQPKPPTTPTNKQTLFRTPSSQNKPDSLHHNGTADNHMFTLELSQTRSPSHYASPELSATMPHSANNSPLSVRQVDTSKDSTYPSGIIKMGENYERSQKQDQHHYRSAVQQRVSQVNYNIQPPPLFSLSNHTPQQNRTVQTPSSSSRPQQPPRLYSPFQPAIISTPKGQSTDNNNNIFPGKLKPSTAEQTRINSQQNLDSSSTLIVTAGNKAMNNSNFISNNPNNRIRSHINITTTAMVNNTDGITHNKFDDNNALDNIISQPQIPDMITSTTSDVQSQKPFSLTMAPNVKPLPTSPLDCITERDENDFHRSQNRSLTRKPHNTHKVTRKSSTQITISSSLQATPPPLPSINDNLDTQKWKKQNSQLINQNNISNDNENDDIPSHFDDITPSMI